MPSLLHAQQTIDLRNDFSARIREHSIGPFLAIHTNIEKLPREFQFSGITFDVTIGVDGHVRSASAISGPPQFFTQAQQIEAARTFRPFADPHGKPVQARIHDSVAILPPERWRTPHEPFPANIDLTTLSITLQRTACYGSCPIYTVTLFGDGRVQYEGETFVQAKGKRSSHITPAQVQALLEDFRRADFFSALPQYVAGVTDMPSENITFHYNGKTRGVDLYAPGMAGAPDSIANLPTLIDETAGTAKWIGNGSR